jgi:hypothetical protein
MKVKSALPLDPLLVTDGIDRLHPSESETHLQGGQRANAMKSLSHQIERIEKVRSRPVNSHSYVETRKRKKHF